jgi:hypothetical protein
MGSKHVDAQHHPDEQERNSRDDNVANPLADGSGLSAVFHGLCSFNECVTHGKAKELPLLHERRMHRSSKTMEKADEQT